MVLFNALNLFTSKSCLTLRWAISVLIFGRFGHMVIFGHMDLVIFGLLDSAFRTSPLLRSHQTIWTNHITNFQTQNQFPQFFKLVFIILVYSWTRELFIQGKAMVPYVQLSTNCRIGFWYNENKVCTVVKLSSPQLVDNCTYGTIAFPSIKSSLTVVAKWSFLLLLVLCLEARPKDV